MMGAENGTEEIGPERTTTISGKTGQPARVFRVPIPLDAPTFSPTEYFADMRSRFATPSCHGVAKYISNSIPGLRWMRKYRPRQSLQGDFTAGLAVGVMTIPLSVAFASMAGLPAAFGLYTCLGPSIAFGFFGGSRHLAVGPVALVSLLLSDGLGSIVEGAEQNTNPNKPANPEVQAAYNRAAVQVSLVVGLIYAVLHRLRLGFVCNLLSRPIISSFLTAGAMLISLSQVKYILGFNIPPGNKLHVLLANLAKNLPEARWQEIIMGCFWLLLLFCVRKSRQLHRWLGVFSSLGPIIVAGLSIAVVWGFDLEATADIQVIGVIQPGLMPVTVSWWFPMRNFPRLLTLAAAITLVSLLEAISIAKALGEKHGDRIEPSNEISGLAASNLVGAALGAYPSTGSFARSAVCSDSGGKTGLSGFISAGVVAATLLFLTSVFEHMPMNAMAAIVIMGVLGLLDFQRALFYLKVSTLDFVVWIATFLASLFLGIDLGLGTGIAVSLLFLFARLAFARVNVLTQVPGSKGQYQSQEDILKYIGLGMNGVNGKMHREQPAAHESLRNAHRNQLESLPLRPSKGTSGQQMTNGAAAEMSPTGSFQSSDDNSVALLERQEEGRMHGYKDRSDRFVIYRPTVPLCFANIQSIQDQIGAGLPPPEVESERLALNHKGTASKGETSNFMQQGTLDNEIEEEPQISAERSASGISASPTAGRHPSVALILDLSSSAFVDSTAVEKLKDWQSKLKQQHIRLLFAGPSEQVMQIFHRAGLLREAGEDAAFWRLEDAIESWKGSHEFRRDEYFHS